VLGGVGGRVDSAFDSCSIDTGSNPAEAGHCVAAVGKLFTLTVPNRAVGQLNQLIPGIAGTSVVTLGKSFSCVGSGLLSLSFLIEKSSTGQGKGGSAASAGWMAGKLCVILYGMRAPIAVQYL